MKKLFSLLVFLCGSISAQYYPFRGGTGIGSATITRTVVNYSATPTFTCLTHIQEFEVTLTGNITSSTLSGCSAGDYISFRWIQDGTGGRTVVYPTGFSSACSISTTASGETKQLYYWDGTNAVPLAGCAVSDPGLAIPETTAPTGITAWDLLYADSTAHRLKMNNNNGGADTVVGAATTDTFTNKTFDTAGSGNSFSINGVGVTANTGTGAVARAASPTFTTPTLGDATATSMTVGGALVTNNVVQNSKSAAYTTVLGDAGKHIYHPSADTTARTWTIDSNANVAYPIGTTITFVNDTSAGVLTIAITSDTLVLAGAGSTGSRTIAAGGIATAIKVTSTRWIINGTGLT